MTGIIDYITAPQTIISFIVFVFGLGVTWSKLNSRIKQLEKKTEEMDMVKIQTTLSQIQTDIEWIKKTLVK